MKKLLKSLTTILTVLILSLSVCSSNASYISEITRDNIQTPITVDTSLTGFVTRLYANILNRKPDDGGLKYWVNKISSGEKSVVWVSTYGFFHSKEYKNKKTTNEQFVTTCYKTFLDRSPEKAGYNYWLNKLRNGMSRDDVLNGFAYSKEFLNIQSRFGIGKISSTSTKSTVSSSSNSETKNSQKYNGRISIHRVGYSMYIQTGKSTDWQKIVDNEETALLVENFLGKQMVADHASQGLKLMKNCKPGDKMTITLNGKTTNYIMTTIYKNAFNNGGGILVNGKYADEMNDGELFMYCCNDSSGKSVTVTFWRKV